MKCVLKYRPETTGVDFVGVSLPLNCISKDYIVSESTINHMISYEQHLEKSVKEEFSSNRKTTKRTRKKPWKADWG